MTGIWAHDGFAFKKSVSTTKTLKHPGEGVREREREGGRLIVRAKSLCQLRREEKNKKTYSLMSWNSNSRQSPLVLTDLQSVRLGPRDASVNVAVRNASRKLSWEELSKFTPNSPVLGVKMRIICPSQLQPAVPEAIKVPHDATAERHVRSIIALWFNFSRYYRQCVRVSGLEKNDIRGAVLFFFSAKEFERTHTEAPSPFFVWGIIRAMSDGILQLHPIAMKGPTSCKILLRKRRWNTEARSVWRC